MKQDKIQKIIEDIFKHTNSTIDKCEFVDEYGMLWCRIDTPDSHLFIGRDGETLKSLNHIVNRMLEKEYDSDRENIIIDINNYQKKYFDNIKTLSMMMAERARFFKTDTHLEPQSPYDRRIVHMYLENSKDLKTESAGSGRDRHVVIKYIGEDII